MKHFNSLWLAAFSVAAAIAQTPTATLVGRVIDTSGAAMAGVRITVLNTATGDLRHTTTTESADFTVPNLAPGAYNITAEREGFRTMRREGLELQVDQVARLELAMESARWPSPLKSLRPPPRYSIPKTPPGGK